jgi:hypothetical protein
MPHELQNLDELTDTLLARTLVVYRKGGADMIKYKLRTKKTLFTIKVPQGETTEIETRIEGSGQPIEIIDI